MKSQELVEQLNKKEPLTKRSILLIILAAVLFFLVIFFGFFVSQGVVDGDSMNPTLTDGDRVLIFNYEKVDRFDIVAFNPPGQPAEEYVKRVIGMPGDDVAFDDGVLYINGEVTPEDHLEPEDNYSSPFWNFDLQDILEITPSLAGEDMPATIPDEMYLVLGDNRNNSEDSRTFGLISAEEIIGVVHFRYRPLTDFGILH
ncbi:signal peptidase I [Enterococcus sp. HY326]|uniref:signal peptidase I n=1 Tax=Enterococcus sp. HY326 TaxID=2971265 RepID=UPI002240A032|nr:signal peptidase I [Enterococcus sp. HY326]